MTDPTEASAGPRLEPVDESWSTALALVAHPDDLEYGAASAIARWTAQGKRIVYCLATSGEAGIDGVAPSSPGRYARRSSARRLRSSGSTSSNSSVTRTG